MPENTLYNVISKKTSKENQLPETIRLHHRNYHNGAPYFIFDLPKNEEELGSYVIHEHHVSVFKSPEGRREQKSQYHYTAKIKDKDGNLFRFHLFFNHLDKPVDDPLLARITADGETEYITASQEDIQVFVKYASHSINSVVIQLRKDQQNLIAQLKAEYDKLEARAIELSKDLGTNREAYKTVIDRQLEALQEMSNYNAGSSLDKINYLKMLKRLLAIPKQQQTPHLETKVETKETKRPQKKSGRKKAKSGSPKLQAKKAPLLITKKVPLDKEIAALSAQVKQLAELKDDALINKIAAIDIGLRDLEVEIDEKTPLPLLRELCDLRLKLDTQGSKVLRNLLILGKYDKATPLGSFGHLVVDKIVELALATNNAVLLDFLFDNNYIPRPYTNFTVEGKKYACMMDYFFQKASKSEELAKQEAMAACVNVLIQQGESLLEINPQNGEVYLAEILTVCQHPFCDVLMQNRNSTIDDPVYIKKYVRILNGLKSQASSTSDQKGLLECLITLGQLQICAIRNKKNTAIKQSIFDLERDSLSYTQDILGFSWSNTMVEENVIKLTQLRLNVEQRFEQIASVSDEHKAWIIERFTEAYEKLNQTVKTLKDAEEVPEPEDFRKHCIKYLTYIDKDIQLLLTLTECCNELKKLDNKHGAQRKQRASLEKQDEQIRKEMEKHYDLYDQSLEELEQAGKDAAAKRKKEEATDETSDTDLLAEDGGAATSSSAEDDALEVVTSDRTKTASTHDMKFFGTGKHIKQDGNTVDSVETSSTGGDIEIYELEAEESNPENAPGTSSLN